MSDPYRQYRPNQGYEYPEEYDYPPYAGSRRDRPPGPDYDRSAYGREYERPTAYEPLPPRTGAPRDYRPPPPRAEPPEYPSRRGGRGGDYPPAPAPRVAPRDPYVEPAYYPPQDRHARPPPRDTYEQAYAPPEPSYAREDPRYSSSRRRPRPEDDYDPHYGGGGGREYEQYYEEPVAAGRRPQPPPIEYARGPGYGEIEPPSSRSRRPRDSREPPVKLPASKPSPPEDDDDELILPAEGIRKEILQKYITRFLGSDAVSRGPMKVDGILVYKYSAYRHFTPEQIRDLKTLSEKYEPSYPRGTDPRGEGPGPIITSSSSRPSNRRNTDEDAMIAEPPMPRDEYVYSTGNQGTRLPAREIRAGRSPHDPPYGTSYHEPSRHGRPPIEASAMRQDDDDEMQD
ncbi:hypothetical protein ABW20_dc0100599 [Dactylellina cionopaga]|nr:hypothetical protein ABW20_dc0100599 [Dactylellina cionopaga]